MNLIVIRSPADLRLTQASPAIANVTDNADGTLIGIALSRTIVAPMFRLADAVQDMHPDRPSPEFASEFQDDEVGLVARRLGSAMERNEAFVERERRFARFASHELRTPVAVMKGALELRVDETRADRSGPLRRMPNSIGDMEALIETFLMLAREKFVKMPDESIDAAELLDSVVEQHCYLLQHKNVAVRNDVREGLILRLPRSPVKVVLANLIQNAFRYTDSGSVTILLDENSASVIDTGIGLSSETSGYPTAGGIADRSEQRVGVGLEIVETLCSLYDWELVIEPNDPIGTRASVKFDAGRRVGARTA